MERLMLGVIIAIVAAPIKIALWLVDKVTDILWAGLVWVAKKAGEGAAFAIARAISKARAASGEEEDRKRAAEEGEIPFRSERRL